jgi:hypothetical protein
MTARRCRKCYLLLIFNRNVYAECPGRLNHTPPKWYGPGILGAIFNVFHPCAGGPLSFRRSIGYVKIRPVIALIPGIFLPLFKGPEISGRYLAIESACYRGTAFKHPGMCVSQGAGPFRGARHLVAGHIVWRFIAKGIWRFKKCAYFGFKE